MLETFFNPKSVAVIGASSNPQKLGFAVVDNLIKGGYAKFGSVYPINPGSGEILGLKTFHSVVDVPDSIDLGVIVIPYPLVPDALRTCGEKGIPSVVIISAGFREVDLDGLNREMELITIAKQYNLRIIGPNCLGIIDTHTPLNASFAAGSPPQGPMAFMSQSGALGAAILDWAKAGRLGLSKFVSLGNKADVNEVDLMQVALEDPNTNVILMYTEGLPDGSEFIRVARQITRQKPVVAIKSGVTQSGSRAVSSHTGSLAGSEQAYQAAFQQAGVLRANSMEELFDMAMALGYQPILKGDQIAIVTNAGGPGILATDALERAGLNLARFTLETKQKLDGYLPGAASAANPVDVLGDARSDRYMVAMDTVIADPNVDGVLVLLTPQALSDIDETAHVITHSAAATDKPILACFMGEVSIQSGIAILLASGIPNYPFPERAALAFKAMSLFRRIKNRPEFQPEHFKVNHSAVRVVIDQVWADGRNTIGEAEARKILEAYGFTIPSSKLARNSEEAIRFASEIGYPIVLKIVSPDILHKTDIGGVKIGIQNAEQLRDAFDLMLYRVERYLPEAQIWGCLVQSMVPEGGLEVLLGMNRDPQFGPLVTFGLGGIYVEVLKDVTFRLAPFSKLEAEEMLEEIRARALLDGIRGQTEKDKTALVDSLLRIGQLVLDFPEILELDINPLVVYEKGQGVIAIDMRLVLSDSPHNGDES